MKHIVLSIVVIGALVVAGIGGTFAGFVDTEVSEGNLYTAGNMDLLIDDSNDPLSVFNVTCGVPCTSNNEWVKVENRGECTGAMLYLHFKDVVSTEAGRKNVGTPETPILEICEREANTAETDWEFTYRTATGTEPVGATVATSEPEMGAEHGGNYIAQWYIEPDKNPDGTTNVEPGPDPSLMGLDYASGIADHLGVVVEVCDTATADGWLDNPDTNSDGTISDGEYSAADWVTIFDGKLVDIECDKTMLGKMDSQDITYVHITVHLQQIYAKEWCNQDSKVWPDYASLWPAGAATGVDYDTDGDIDTDDFQKAVWPTNALQGDKATFAMLWELNTDF